MVNLLSATKILKEVDSPINGKIRVVRSLGLGIYIQVEGLTQSGGVVGAIWKATFRKIKKAKKKVRKVLILGLGGGTAATLIQKYWPGADIIGVDIDPLIIELGRKYLGLTGVRVVVNDAKAYLLRNRPKSEYNLVIVDTYLGYEYPKAFEKEEFLLLVKKSLAPGGMAVFNRLYFSEKRTFSQKFADKLEKIFTSVERYFPEANLMLLCRP